MEKHFPGRDYILVLEGEEGGPYTVTHSLGDNDAAANALMGVAGEMMGIVEPDGRADA